MQLALENQKHNSQRFSKMQQSDLNKSYDITHELKYSAPTLPVKIKFYNLIEYRYFRYNCPKLFFVHECLIFGTAIHTQPITHQSFSLNKFSLDFLAIV